MIPDQAISGKTAIAGFPLARLTETLDPLPRFRAKQIFSWIASGCQNFSDMNNLPLALREELAARFYIRSSKIEQKLEDTDGTVKLVIALEDGAKIEAVLLGDEDKRHVAEGKRTTACISTQAGCPIGCVFCKTGSLGFKRDLTASEIVEQFLWLRETAAGTLDNMVIMGMGEPLLNIGNLRPALEVICSKQGINFSKRRITLSTCGIAQGIRDIVDNGLASQGGPDVRLALSLVTADEALRKRLMPIANSESLASVKDALRYHHKKGGGRITLEAVLFSGINTRVQDAQALAEFARGLDVMVNLIPWNPVDLPTSFDPPLREPARQEVAEFITQLEARGLKVNCRFRRGRGVSGACGQLGSV